MSVWDELWLLWVGLFWCIEIPAVIYERKHGSGATLSAHLRFWFSMQKLLGPYPRVRRVLGIVAVLWLPLHLFFGLA